jgi:hypothetical protein
MGINTTISREDALGVFTQTIIDLVTIDPEVPDFFRTFFRTIERASYEVTFEVVRSGRVVHEDMDIYSGPKIVKNLKSSQNMFVPPFYDIAYAQNAYDAFQRQVGTTGYISEADMVSYASEVARGVQLNLDNQDRTEELLAAQVMDSGVVTLVNSDSVDFKRKTESMQDYDAAADFSINTVDPLKILQTDANFMVDEGKVDQNEVINVVMGEEVANAFENNPNIKEKADNRRYEDIVRLSSGQTISGGARSLGIVKQGTFNFRLWVYAGRYDAVDGETNVRFLDTKKYVMLPNSVDFIYFYGGCPAWSGPKTQANRYTVAMTGRRCFYEAEDELAVSKLFGFKTRPLPIPRQVDRIVTRTVLTDEEQG